MIEPNKNYVLEEDGSIHELIFCGDCDWEERAVTTLEAIKQCARAKAIDEFAEAFKKANITKRVYERIFYMVQSGEGFHDAVGEVDNMYCELASKIAEQLKEGGK